MKILTILIGMGCMLLFQSCSNEQDSFLETEKKKMQNSKQFRDGKFRNTKEWIQPPIYKQLGLIWEFIKGGKQRTPNQNLPSRKVDLTYFNDTAKNNLNATWLGHSSLMINIDGNKILTDPVFESKVTLFGPWRYNGELPLDIAKLPQIDVVIISHNHYDHLNKYSIELIKDKVGRFITTLGVGKQLREWGVPANKITELDWNEGYTVSPSLHITATPSQHFSGRGLFDRDEALWASWVIQGTNHRIFFSGDSGYFDGFKKIGDTYGPFDMTFLECGAYNERWHHIHMYPEETVQAHIDLKGKVLHPIHWGTFNLAFHAWYEPMERFAKAAKEKKIKTATPIVGETTVYGKEQQQSWWESLK